MKIKNKATGITIGLVAAALVVAAVSAYALKIPPFTGKDTVTPDGQSINMEKSDAEKQVEEDLRNNPDKKTEGGVDVPKPPEVDESTNKQVANVLITSVEVINGQVDARGFATNVAESDGMCRFIFKKEELTVIKETGILPGGTTSTTCRATKFSKDELPIGTWKVELEYVSPQSYGKSTAATLEVL